MNEILERIAMALEDGNKIAAKSVSMNEEWLTRHRALDELYANNALLSTERYYFLRMQELIRMFAQAGEYRENVLPSLYAAATKWYDTTSKISPAEGLDSSIIEKMYLNATHLVHQDILNQAAQAGTKELSKDLTETLEMIDEFLENKEKTE
jgi:hypothetical protein